MTDETRKQISPATVWLYEKGFNEGYAQGFKDGDKRGYNLAIDEVLKELESLRPLIDGFTEFTDPNALPHAKANMLDTCIKVTLEKVKK
jgi:flagellar biosynthesis/type III secretory pathway protein FliH